MFTHSLLAGVNTILTKWKEPLQKLRGSLLAWKRPMEGREISLEQQSRLTNLYLYHGLKYVPICHYHSCNFPVVEYQRTFLKLYWVSIVKWEWTLPHKRKITTWFWWLLKKENNSTGEAHHTTFITCSHYVKGIKTTLSACHVTPQLPFEVVLVGNSVFWNIGQGVNCPAALSDHV